MIRYERPRDWARYDIVAIQQDLSEAKAVAIALQTLPYQREWVQRLQRMQLMLEVAGTSRIEGADFTERELDAVLAETAEQMVTRSQRQAFAALQTYKWIAELPPDVPITPELIRDIHRRMVTGADDDRCPPGEIRGRDQNVEFGTPRQRGCEGAPDCAAAVQALTEAIGITYRDHDPLVQALSAHYHLAAIHPFLDGNGRTARALEALMLHRAGLRDTSFIAMSNYYHDEKPAYLAALAEARARGHDLTPFLGFGLRGVARQTRRLLAEIQREVQKALFRDLMFDLFGRLRSPRKRVIAQRQLEILKVLLDQDGVLSAAELMHRLAHVYRLLRKPMHALRRDLAGLDFLGAIEPLERDGEKWVALKLDWPTEITETEFFRRTIKALPRARTHRFLP